MNNSDRDPLVRDTRVVHHGRIMLKGRIYRHQSLIRLERKRVELQYDPFDPGEIMVFYRGKYLCTTTVRERMYKVLANTNDQPKSCHDCGALPGQVHRDGCDVERCSVCGGQRLMCGCAGHDKGFARWTGWWPGELEARALGVDLNTFYTSGIYRLFFVKPSMGINVVAKGPGAIAAGRDAYVNFFEE